MIARCPFHDWQYLSMRVAAKTAYTSLRIILVYECNANVVYFNSRYYNPVWGRFISAYPPTLTLNARCLQGAEKHLAASLLPHLLVYFWVFSSSSSRSVIFRRLMPRVDPLCSSAEVAGGSTPATPSAISVRLKPTMKR